MPTLVSNAQPTPFQRNLPNALVWLRLALAAVFVAILSIGDSASTSLLLLAAAIFIVAALTDTLDGFLARRWNVISRFGRVMDPFADKVLVLGAFVMLAGPAFAREQGNDLGYQASGVYPWMAVVILARELLVTSLRALIEGEGGDFSAEWSGKAKMVVQSVAVPIILLTLARGRWSPEEPGRIIIDAAAWTTVVVTLASGIPYLLHLLRRAP
ncbi:MAG: CDP-diacylglycerol--glycerol-3-phosphate 3-phosphatidyltransferase [Phycisphaerales bacterium]|nr:CDP-diacylglycerol--glycerol-3-phosphate 3-phosphatidyltransferase [Phycisphaerales bacterium]